MNWSMDFMNNIDEYIRLEKELIKIEKMDKDGLSLDDQCDLLCKYNKLWNRINELNETK